MSSANTDGYIAVWLGCFKKEEDFIEYKKVHYEYDDEIEDIDSLFEKDFELKYYDRTMVETNFRKEENNSLKTLFSGASYLDKYVNNLNDKNMLSFNVIIRVYDFKFTGEKKFSIYKDNIIKFYGNIEYEKKVDLSWMGL